MLKVFLLSCMIGLAFSTTCRDGSFCPGFSTCCLTPRGVGCCPYQNANCCGDGLHCCPYGFQCNSTGGCYGGTVANIIINGGNKETALTFISEEAVAVDSFEDDLKKVLKECIASQNIRDTYEKLLIECHQMRDGVKKCKDLLVELLEKGYLTTMECFRKIGELIIK